MKLTSLASWASGFNWYKLGIYAVLFLSWTGGVYGLATYNCNMDHERQKTAEAKEETKQTVQEVVERLPQVQVREVESAKQRAEIQELKRKLDDALSTQNRPTACDLSDAEFSAVNGLLNRTHQK